MPDTPHLGQQEKCDACLLESFRFQSRALALCIVLLASIVLIAWVFGVGPMADLIARQYVTKPNSALCFLLSGIASLLLAGSGKGSRRMVVAVLAVIITMLGILTVAEYAFGWHLGIDQALFPEGVRVSAGGPLAVRMAMATAAAFVLIGIGLLLDTIIGRHRRPAEWLFIIPGLMGLLGLMDHLFDPSFTQLHMPVVTAVSFVVLAVALLFARPEDGLMAVVSGYSLGGITARRLIPIMVFLSVALGWVRWKGEQAGLYEAEFGVALYVTANVLLVSILIWRVARSLEHVEKDRELANEIWRDRNEELRQQAERQIAELVRSSKAVQMERDSHSAGGSSS